jgi:3-phosphoshikimate 1-carboxyvinyltransferase
MNDSLRAESGGRLAGRIAVPGDKSISHRALMLGAISEGRSSLSGFLEGEDCLATAAALRALGVRIDSSGSGAMTVHGVGLHGLRAAEQPLDVGNSGTAMRLLTGLLCAQRFSSTLIGDDSLMQRPMGRIARPLGLMGANVATVNGKPPVTIEPVPGLKGIDYDLPVASAQVKSAILLAGLYAEGTTRTRCPGVTRDHTERMLADLGAKIEFDNETRVVELHGPAQLNAMDRHIPGDFSSAAFFIVAGLLGGDDELMIENVGLNPTRIGLLHILREMGGEITVHNERVIGGEPTGDLTIRRSALTGIDVPVEHVASAIDEFPVLFVAAACAQGTTRLRGAEELRHKETDRLAVMAAALLALGASVREYADGMDVIGGQLTGGRVDSCGDHRVAMAAAVASLGIRGAGTIEISNAAQVATSFPGFVETATAAGLRVSAFDDG